MAFGKNILLRTEHYMRTGVGSESECQPTPEADPCELEQEVHLQLQTNETCAPTNTDSLKECA